MVKDKIIEPITKPTDWVSNIVIIEKKNKSLRICLDPKDLNAGIKRQHYQMPVLDDITSDLHNTKVFSTFDAKNGYY